MKFYKKIAVAVTLMTIIFSLALSSQVVTKAATASSAACNPTTPVAGQNITITYNSVGGVLQAASKINMHWGYDGWKGVSDAPMTSQGKGVWTVTVQVPAAAGSAINCCFNDGNGNWDSNASGKNWNFLFKEPTKPVSAPGTITDITINPGSNASILNFCWYSYQIEGDAVVQVALKSDMTGTDFPVGKATTFAGQKSAGNDGYTSNKVTVTNLKEAAQYVYRVGDGSSFSDVYSFNTQKTSDFSFLAAGDPQIGASGDINSDSKGWANTLNIAANNFPNASFLLSLGDEVNNGGELNGGSNESEYTGFFTPSQLRSLPISAFAGNHETDGVGHIYHFNNPNMSSQYGANTKEATTGGDYYFTYGNTLFLVLNSNDTNEAEHKAFMQAAISANPQATWKIAAFHHAPYSSANHCTDSDIIDRRNNLVPIIESLGIDVVLNGHDHNYTRSNFMKSGSSVTNQNVDKNGTVIDPNGVLYITANSASGSKFYEFNSKLDKSYVAKNEQNHRAEISTINVTNNSFKITTYHVDDMSVVDTISLAKTNVADDAAVAAIGAISALPDAGSITINDNAAIQAARAAYNALNDTEKTFVTNLSKLIADEAKIAQLQASSNTGNSSLANTGNTTNKEGSAGSSAANNQSIQSKSCAAAKAQNIPQTGSFFDTKLLIEAGIILLVLGSSIIIYSKLKKTR